MRVYFCVFFLLAAAAARCPGQPAGSGVKWPGLQPDGSVLLHNQWSVHPAGRQIELGSCFPVNIAVEPAGRYAAVLHAGYGPHEIVVVGLMAGAVASRARLHETFYGLVFSADGKTLYCSGAGDEVVHRFSFLNGQLTNDIPIKVHDRTLRAVPCGLAVDRKGNRLFVADLLGDGVAQVCLGPQPGVMDFSVGANDSYPYACCLDERRQRLYVSLWAQAAVCVLDLPAGNVAGRWPTEEHPCEMVLTHSGRLLYAANANRNTVSVLDTATGQPLETIWAAFFPDAPPGSTPNSLALSPDEKTLYVANANVNAIAVFDVSSRRQSASRGFIPVGWYPTSVRVTPDGRHLLVANGKGGAAKANPRGPWLDRKTSQYIASLYEGTLSVIDLSKGAPTQAQMAAWTAEVYRRAPLRAGEAVAAVAPPGNPIPPAVGQAGPIQYVIYIIKENRTYDQVFGDMPQGNGDAKLCLFPERVTPNHHKLARDFVLLDNFYADAEVSASGHEWSMGAYCTDFVEKTWPLDYGHDRDGKFPYPGEGNFPIATPASGYLWDRARQAAVSYRSYGEFINFDEKRSPPARPQVKGLEGHIDPMYRGFDLDYSDLKRADRFIAEFKRLAAADQMPRLQIVRLPNDHTHGATPLFPTPTAYVAENDLALGRIVEAVSHSKFWPQTAIFVVEDDSQNGSDHVDAHRTVALAISPYARRGATDSTMYSTTSLLRTMELILGLKPLSQFDAAATPMFASFQPALDPRPYEAAPATANLDEKNPLAAWGGNLKMNFAKEDAADEDLLNQAVWKSVRGAASPMPAPVHAAFVLPHKGDDD
jgi:YVTN family beta-propeller protein